MAQQVIRALAVEYSQKLPANKLTRLQNFVCKVFKITPEKTFTYCYRLRLDETSDAMVTKGNILISNTGIRWIVISKYPAMGNLMEVASIEPMAGNVASPFSFIILGTALMEGSAKK